MSKRNRRGKNRRAVSRASAPASLNGDVQAPLPGAVLHGIATSSVSYSGPIPPPHFLREYEEIVPGSAERILAMAENQTNHRIAMEDRALNSGINRSWGGLLSGFVIGMTCLCFGGFGMLSGHETTGFLFGASGLAGLVGVFVVGKYFTAKERTDKDQAMRRR